MLDPVTIKLKEIQRQLKALLPPKAVLVGHSLDLDLKALKVSPTDIGLSISSIYACSIYLKYEVWGSSFLSPLVFSFSIGCYSFYSLSFSDDISICY